MVHPQQLSTACRWIVDDRYPRSLRSPALCALPMPHYVANAFPATINCSTAFSMVCVMAAMIVAAVIHALSPPRYGMATVGNIYTVEQARSQGYAYAVTAVVQ